ncbi:UbiH/UbiF/VisC/COQ6 family ubiquinone biosynthesis hydroxylase [Reinekea thalattae]|uniref:FAD-binding domain-containing protein n=1 Tax=Reinekea thalattae TaxID=2593301 RepID=A0A5C8Z9A8_9GAMM|nr:UbiH/UbiF/VisC/COQ6 family ubiquinone biosynthesis hydroxylase [Reinekea thalattae]TXR54297.1 hypothetical protein FME95_07110 [Reinekea thalattae]
MTTFNTKSTANTEPAFNYDLVISGGGMVGLALAIAAAKLDLTVAVIEKNTAIEPSRELNGPTPYNSRVSAINHSSEQLLKNLKVWQQIPHDRLSAYQQMHVWDRLGEGALTFHASDAHQTHLGHIIENQQLLSALTEIAQQHRLISLKYTTSIESWHQDAQQVRLTTDSGETLTCRQLIACEGKQSVLREQAGIASWRWNYHHSAVVCTVRHQQAHQQCARQVFLESGPLAFLPLPDEHQSAIVWSTQPDQADALLAMSDEQFCQQLEYSFETQLGKVEAVSKRQLQPLSAQQAQLYFNNRLVIVGDSAHAIHPLAGLGVNLGFLDVAALAEQWQWAKGKSIDIADRRVMRRFQRQRQSHNLAVAGLMETIKRLFSNDSTAAVILRNRVLKRLNPLSTLKRPLIEGAMGLTGVTLPPLCQPNDE